MVGRWDYQNKRTRTSPARHSFVLKAALCNLCPSIIYSYHVIESFKELIGFLSSPVQENTSFRNSVTIMLNYFLKHEGTKATGANLEEWIAWVAILFKRKKK